MDSSDQGDVLYGPDGFSYIPFVDPMKDGGRTLVRDALDDLFFEAEYIPERERDLSVYFQVGGGEEDGDSGGLSEERVRGLEPVEDDNVFYRETPGSEVIGIKDPVNVDEWDRTLCCVFEYRGLKYEFEDIREDTSSVKIQGSLDDLEALVSGASQALTDVTDYTLESEPKDAYWNDKKPYDLDSEGHGKKKISEDDRDVIERTVKRSLNLSQDVLEGDVPRGRWDRFE